MSESSEFVDFDFVRFLSSRAILSPFLLENSLRTPPLSSLTRFVSAVATTPVRTIIVTPKTSRFISDVFMLQPNRNRKAIETQSPNAIAAGTQRRNESKHQAPHPMHTCMHTVSSEYTFLNLSRKWLCVVYLLSLISKDEIGPCKSDRKKIKSDRKSDRKFRSDDYKGSRLVGYFAIKYSPRKK